MRHGAMQIGLLLLLFVGAAAAEKSYEGTSPPGALQLRFQGIDLALQAEFRDANGNRALDAGERATVVVRVVNQGPGKAYQVEVEGQLQSVSGHVRGNRLKEKLGTLAPGKSATAELGLSADEEVENGVVVVRFTAQDRYQREAQPLEVTLESRVLAPPDLRVADVGIDDDDQGNSYGNANGKIEKGETIEVKAIVQNQGQGEAGAVVVDLTPAEGVFFMGKQRFNLGDLGPGKYQTIDFAFTVPPGYAGGAELPFRLTLREARGRFGREEVLTLAMDKVEKRSAAVQAVQVAVSGAPQGEVAIVQAPALSVDVETDIPRGKKSNPDGVAVVIGNRDYAERYPDVPDVEFAVRDAAVVKEYLQSALGYKEGNILYFANATNADFRRVFGTEQVREGRLAQLVKPGKSEVFVYYSGHGAPDVQAQQGYFVPVDCAPGDVRLNGYPLELFYENLGRIEAKSFTVVIDACFSGGSQQGMLIAGASPIGIRVVNPALTLRNGVVFTSSSGDEISSWYPEKRHGLFTYFFLKGLQGAADGNGDGRVAAGELGAYLGDRSEGVPYWARRLYQGRQQTPGVFGDSERVILEVKR